MTRTNPRNQYFALLFVVLACLHKALPVFAEEPDVTPRFETGGVTSTYTDKTAGFSIELPEDFRLSSEQGDLLYFQSHERRGTMIVRPVPGLALSTVQSRLRNGLQAESVSIKPEGSPDTLQLQGAQGLIMEAGGSLQGREVFGKLAGIFGTNGQGYMILIGAVRERWLGFKPTANRMIQSFSVMPAQPGFEHERWTQRIEGTHLVFFEAKGSYYSGAAFAEEYHFCSDRSFTGRFNTTQTASDAWRRYTSSSGRKSKGTWRVSYDGGYSYLILTHNRGPQQTYALSDTEGYITLDNVPFMFAVNDLCP